MQNTYIPALVRPSPLVADFAVLEEPGGEERTPGLVPVHTSRAVLLVYRRCGLGKREVKSHGMGAGRGPATRFESPGTDKTVSFRGPGGNEYDFDSLQWSKTQQRINNHPLPGRVPFHWTWGALPGGTAPPAFPLHIDVHMYNAG
jgi:hypothetical protein